MTALRVLVAGAGANIFSANRRGLAAIGAEVVEALEAGRPPIAPGRESMVALELANVGAAG